MVQESAIAPWRLTSPYVGRRPVTPQYADGVRIDPVVSEPNANGTRPAATALPEPLDEPPDQRVRSHGFRPGAEQRGVGNAVAAAARQFHHGEFANQHRARLIQLLSALWRFLRTSAPHKASRPTWWVAGERQQILRAVRDALQRAPVTLLLQILIDRLSRAAARFP